MSIVLFIGLVAFLAICFMAKLAGAGVRFVAWVLKCCWVLFAFIALVSVFTDGDWLAWGLLALLGYLFSKN